MTDANRYWWEAAEGSDDQLTADLLVERCRTIEDSQIYLYEDNIRHAKMYDGRVPPHYQWNSGIIRSDGNEPELTKNVIRSVVDTATALIARTRPKATIVTDGANWDVQMLAKDLDNFLVGAFNMGGLYKTAPMSFRDSCIFGSGAWRLSLDGDGDEKYVCMDRVPIGDIVVDESLCLGGQESPEIFQRRLVTIQYLKKKYPKLADKIEAVKEDNSYWTQGRAMGPGQCVLVEGWYIDAGKARYVKAIRGLVLANEPWPFECHPFIFLHWSPPIEGFYGKGIAYALSGRQRRINAVYRFITKCQELVSVPRVWVDAAAGPMKTQMVPEIGVVLATPGGKPPVWQIPQAVAPEIYSWLNSLEQGSYEEIGISQASASNRLPPGIESAPAQREYSYKEGQRFAPVSQRYEDAFVETAYKTIEMYAHLYKSGVKPRVRYAERTVVHNIDWPLADELDESRYLIRVEASSMESLSPAGRIQATIELGQAGILFDQKELRSLLSHPDLIKSDQMTNAAFDDAMATYQALIKGEEISPMAYQDLALVTKVVRAGYLRAFWAKAPQSILDNLNRYLEEVDAKVAEAENQAQQQAAMQAQAAGPPGAPAGPQPALSSAAAQGLGAPFPTGPVPSSREGIQ